MPKYTVTVPIWATATLRHVEGEDADAAVSEAYPPSLCAQCAGMGDPTRSLDLSGDPAWEDAQALLEGEDGEVLESEWERQRLADDAALAAENRRRQDQARDQRDGRRWRQLLSHLPQLDLTCLAADLMTLAEGAEHGTELAELRDMATAMTDRVAERAQATRAAMVAAAKEATSSST